jgi:hypothetical protein
MKKFKTPFCFDSMPNQSTIRDLLLIIVCVGFGSFNVAAQEHATIVGAGGVYELPLGSMHDRFLGTYGGMVYAGVEVSQRLTWIGAFEYTEFNTLNSSTLKKTVTVGQGTSAQQYKLPLPKLSMNLKTAGITAEAQMSLLRSDILEANGVIGFGFTNWVNTRSEYYDSLFINSGSSGSSVKVAALAVPANRQEDWSGTFNLGLELSAKVMEPIWFTVGVDYKMIVGELWQTLDLDLENVAGMQSLSIRAGLKAKL